ncbi:universal stress protein [Labilibacter sediminis]|nr:universal stress protein [Labilibacter sediminis]
MKRILVPIDFSENSLNALGYGVQIANKLNADLRVVHVKNKKKQYRYVQKDVEAMLHDDVEDWMKEISENFKSKYYVPNGVFDYKIREGNVFKEISNQAKYDDSALIVIGTHGASGFEDKWIGSNAYRLVCSAPVSVLTVRPERKWRGIGKIVLPISVDKSSRQKVPTVVGVANLFNAKIVVLGVKEKGFGLKESRVRAFVKQTVRFIENNTDLEVESKIISGGSKAKLVMKFIEEEDADLVATKIHHSSNPFEGLVKPFANELINESSCPVLAVPTKETLYL